MNSEKRKIFLAFVFGGIGMFLVMYMFNGFPQKKSLDTTQNSTKTEIGLPTNKNLPDNISEISKAETVIAYVKTNHQLPEYYITKSEAKKNGWIPSKGNLCEVLPGKAIGGDYFSNREKNLPKGKYYEADVNYNCGNRNADRIVFTKNGEVYLSKDHYKTFQKQ